jgi:hypothetical protein
MYRHKYLIYLVFLIILGCQHPKPEENKLIGTWVSKEGAKLVVGKDNTITIEEFPFKLIKTNSGGVFDGVGKWKIRKSKSVAPFWIMDITIDKVKNKNMVLAIELMISRNGLGGYNSDISTLFTWKGDPDLDNRYEFYPR